MKTKALLGVMGFLLPLLNASAQNKYLQIGDKLPDYQWDSTYNYDGRPLRISDFKGKVLILDFWASWCTDCLKHFPSSDSIQQLYGDRLQVILVNPAKSLDDRDRVLRTFRRYDSVRHHPILLPVAYGDTVAFQGLHFRSLPHYVWVDSGRTIRAVTKAAYLTRDHVEAFLHDPHVDWPVKNDYPVATHRTTTSTNSNPSQTHEK